MNDIELLRRFRSEVPPPDEDARSAAFSAMTQGGELDSRRRRRSDPSGRKWRVAGAFAAVSVAIAVAVAVPAVLPQGHRGGAAPAAAAVLLRAAEVAAQQEADSPPGPGQFVYTKTQNAYENDWADAGPNKVGFSVLMPQIREIWIGTDGSGRILEKNGTPRFLSDRDREVWEAAGRPDLGGGQTSDETFQPATTGVTRLGASGVVATAGPSNSLFFLDLSRLPTDPAELKARIESREIEGGPPGDAETFTIIADLLRETYAPPALRAALYKIAAELPGVELIGQTKDPAGRDGIAVAYTNAGPRHELIFDPDTSVMLAERFVVTDATKEYRVDPGTVVGWAAYLSSGIVDSTSERP